MIGCLGALALAVALLVWAWFHDWETPETLSMKVQERRKDK